MLKDARLEQLEMGERERQEREARERETVCGREERKGTRTAVRTVSGGAMKMSGRVRGWDTERSGRR